MHASPASPASVTLPGSPTAPLPPAPPRAPHTHDDSLAPLPPAHSAGTQPHHRAPRAHCYPGAPAPAHPARAAWSAWPAWSAWSEGRGPEPAPRFLVRWHLADGTLCHESAASDAEALAFARDARDAAQTEAAVYRLWSILPD